MRLATVGTYPVTVGWVIALLVLVADFVLLIIGGIELKLGLLIGGLAVSRLI